MTTNISSIYRTYPGSSYKSRKINALPVFTGNDKFTPSRSKFLRTFDNLVRDIEKLNFPSIDSTVYSDFDGMNSKQIGKKVESGIGSITKTYTSALVLKLQEQNKLKISDKIIDYLPELKGKLPNIEIITIKQLLNHSSGLPDYSDFNLFPENKELFIKSIENNIIFSEYDYLSAMKNCKTPCKPFNSSVYNCDSEHYSNTNYLLLGLLIKKLTGNTLQESFSQYIFNPLNLKNTKVGLQDHYWHSLKCSFADSGIISTSEDLANFIKAIFVDKTLLSEKSIKLMQEEGLGIGCANLNGQKVLFHSGEVVGSYASDVFFFPKGNKILSVIASYDKDKEYLKRGSGLMLDNVIVSAILKYSV